MCKIYLFFILRWQTLPQMLYDSEQSTKVDVGHWEWKTFLTLWCPPVSLGEVGEPQSMEESNHWNQQPHIWMSVKKNVYVTVTFLESISCRRSHFMSWFDGVMYIYVRSRKVVHWLEKYGHKLRWMLPVKLYGSFSTFHAPAMGCTAVRTTYLNPRVAPRTSQLLYVKKRS